MTGLIEIRSDELRAFEHILGEFGKSPELWIDFLNRLPFRLGESSADRTAPCSVSDAVQETFERAVDGLSDLLHRRRDPAYAQSQQKIILADGRSAATLWSRRNCPRTLPAGPLRRIVREALKASAELDGGLLESWLAAAGGGRALFETLGGLLQKALGMALAEPDCSGIALLSGLAAQNALLAAKERIKAVTIRNFPYAKLEQAVGLALLVSFQTAAAIAEAAATLPPQSRLYTDWLILRLGLSPIAFLSIPDQELHGDVNPYGLPEKAAALLDPLYRAALEAGRTPSGLLERILGSIRAKSASELIPVAVTQAFRSAAIDYLVEHEDPGCEADQLLAQAVPSDEALLTILQSPSALKDIALAIPAGAGREPSDAADRLRSAVERFRANPGWHKRGSVAELADLQALVERFLLHQLHTFLKAYLDPVRRRLVDRRDGSSVAELRQEYEQGRLYRISTDAQPAVILRRRQEEAQLFVDLKGYTSRTAKAKELAMAEFLKAEFYEPILQAARAYTASAHIVSRSQNLQLVNLLGDAVAFSGSIVSLVGLARDIQDIFRNYGEKLTRLAPEDKVASLTAKLGRISARRLAIATELGALAEQAEAALREIHRCAGLDTSAMVKLLQEVYAARFEAIERHYQGLLEQARQIENPAVREPLAKQAQSLQDAHARLRQYRDQTLAHLRGLAPEDLGPALAEILSKPHRERRRTIEERQKALLEEQRSLDAAERDAKGQRGTGLEAGLFISYGAVAEVIEIADDAWGDLRVAISERINEAARGTARNATVMARIEEQRRRAEAECGHELALPFRVYVIDTSSAKLDPHLESLLQRAIQGRDAESRERFFDELRKLEHTTAVVAHATDIYNLGEAISQSALGAYLNQTRGSHQYFQVQIAREELAPEIRERFFLPDSQLHLIVGRPFGGGPQEIELFRYVGQVLFRGFEDTRPTAVYEILRNSSAFVGLLLTHHLERLEFAADPETPLST